MKSILKFITPVLIIALFLGLNLSSYSQGAPPPPPSGGHGQAGDLPAGGNAPIGGGLAILLGLGAAYAGKKAWDHKAEEKEA